MVLRPFEAGALHLKPCHNPKRNGPSAGANWAPKFRSAGREEAGTFLIWGSQSADSIKFCFKNRRVAWFESASGLIRQTRESRPSPSRSSFLRLQPELDHALRPPNIAGFRPSIAGVADFVSKSIASLEAVRRNAGV
jgi:hypothetical protein